MNSPVWHCWAQALTQLVVQVTLWLGIGTMLIAWARRRSPRAAAEMTTGILAGVLLLTVLALFPWPIWYHLPTLAAETEPTLSLPTTPAPHRAPMLPAVGSWQMGAIDPPGPASLVSADPVPEPLIETTDRWEPTTAQSTCWWLRIVALLVTILAGGCLLRFGIALWAIRECRRRSRPVLDADMRQLGEELRRGMGVQRPVELRELSSLSTPATLGWRRPIILLPADWRSWDRAEQTSVLAHELAHIRRGDYAGWLLAQLSQALHGYQPLLHALIGWLRRDQELAADALAATFAGGPARYTQTLCRLALRRDDDTKPGLARAFLPAHLSVTLRVQMLLSRNRRSEPMIATKWRLGLGLALVAPCLMIAGLRSPARAEPEVLAPPPIAPGTAGEAAPTANRTARERDIERRLNLPMTLDYKDTPLQQVIDELRRDTGLNIIVDMPALDEEGIGLDRPVTMNLECLTMKSALILLLRSVHLTYIIKDEVVQVTTEKRARGQMIQRAYSVADLVVPIPNYGTPFPQDAAHAAPAAPSSVKTVEQQLIRLIVDTIHPDSWSEVGGQGTIEYFPLGMALVVNQTADIHEQIAELLEALRRLQDLEVTTEIRLVSVSPAMARRLKREFGVDCTGPTDSPDEAGGRATFLESGQVEKLLKTVQGDRRTNIFQAPRLTLFNGQNATIQSETSSVYVMETEKKQGGKRMQTAPKMEVLSTGLRCGVQAVVSADRRFVRLHCQARFSEIDPATLTTSGTATKDAPKGDVARARPVAQEVAPPRLVTWQLAKTVTVPDGRTAILTGWKRSSTEAGQYGYGSDAETQYLLMTVTSRIRINSSDEEVRQTGVVSAAPADQAGTKEKVRHLLASYQRACRERRFDEARKLAAEALALDPGCFSHGR